MLNDVSGALFPSKCLFGGLSNKLKVQDKTCVHVCELDKTETSAGKLMWVIVQCLWLLCCIAGCQQAQS